MQAELPSVGSDVVTKQGRARVMGQDILTSQLLIQTEDHRRVMIPASEVLTVLQKKGRSKKGDANPEAGNPEEASEPAAEKPDTGGAGEGKKRS
jgi:hypothetical protein